MRNLFLALALLFVTASLHAITVKWTVPNSSYAWDSGIVADSSDTIGIYLVYSQTQYTDAKDVWAATQDSTYKNASVVSVQKGGTTSVNGSSLVNGSSENVDAGISVTMRSKTTVAVQLGETLAGVNKPAEGDNSAVNYQFAASGYFYLVVFDPTTSGDDALYAVSNAVQYTGNPETDAKKGIYSTTADPDIGLNIGDYVDVSWMGGTWEAATTPEPTALALLALGVAGLALRRKI